MKRIWVTLLVFGAALILFFGTPALSEKIHGLENTPCYEKLKASLLRGLRFRDNQDGTVKDNFTGLVWMKNANLGPMDWEYACAACENLVVGPYDDWRLPSERELQSLIDYGVYNPALSVGNPFEGEQPSLYWSSTISGKTAAWIVNFYDGLVFSKPMAESWYVWCVRDGQ